MVVLVVLEHLEHVPVGQVVVELLVMTDKFNLLPVEVLILPQI